jgi:hypothetical protein
VRCPKGPAYHSHWKDAGWVMLMVVAAALAWGVVMAIAGWEFDSLAGAVIALILVVGPVAAMERARRPSGMDRFEHIEEW